MKREYLNSKILDVFNSEKIPTPDYNRIYSNITKKIRKRINPWPALIAIAASLILLTIPKHEYISTQLTQTSYLEFVYDEEELISLAPALEEYENTYSLLAQLQPEELRIIVSELKGGE